MVFPTTPGAVSRSPRALPFSVRNEREKSTTIHKQPINDVITLLYIVWGATAVPPVGAGETEIITRREGCERDKCAW